MKRLPTIARLLGLTLLGAIHAFSAESNPTEKPHKVSFEVGVGTRNQLPVSVIAGLRYQEFTFRLQGMGLHFGANDFWTGIRGSLLWTFFAELPFHFDAGIGGGYEYAEAPNKMHQAINNANQKTYVYPYNYKEELDISAELWAHLYGFYTQVSVPAYQFRDHDTQHVLWGIGYIHSF